jgi:hypothetical protein
MARAMGVREIEEYGEHLLRVLDSVIAFQIAAMRTSVDSVLWLTSVQIEASHKLLDSQRRKT